jgi:hypothetical protein
MVQNSQNQNTVFQNFSVVCGMDLSAVATYRLAASKRRSLGERRTRLILGGLAMLMHRAHRGPAHRGVDLRMRLAAARSWPQCAPSAKPLPAAELRAPLWAAFVLSKQARS